MNEHIQKYTHIERLNGFRYILEHKKTKTTLKLFEKLLREHSLKETLSIEYLKNLITLPLTNNQKISRVNSFLKKSVAIDNLKDYFKYLPLSTKFKINPINQEDFNFMTFFYLGIQKPKYKTMVIKRFNYNIDKQKVTLKQFRINDKPFKDYKTFRFITF